MELLETQDPERRKLMEAAEQHKRELQRQVDQVAARGEQAIKTALIIGGALAVTYLLVSQLTRTRVKGPKLKKAVTGEAAVAEQPEAPSLLAEVGGKVVNAATLLLLDLAREKVSEYLKNRSGRP
jgi:hypothetical protein